MSRHYEEWERQEIEIERVHHKSNRVKICRCGEWSKLRLDMHTCMHAHTHTHTHTHTHHFALSHIYSINTSCPVYIHNYTILTVILENTIPRERKKILTLELATSVGENVHQR